MPANVPALPALNSRDWYAWATAIDAAARAVSTARNTVSSASYTLGATDAAANVDFTNASGVTVTVPADSTYAFPNGTMVWLVQNAAGQVAVTQESGVTLNSPNGVKVSRGQWSVMQLTKRATNDWTLTGELTSTALTGVPTAPTPANGDNSTKIATTAFVAAASSTIPDAVASNSTVLTSATNANTLLAAGVYQATSLPSNGPTGAYATGVWVVYKSGNSTVQDYYENTGSGYLWTRNTSNAGTNWTTWSRQATSSDLSAGAPQKYTVANNYSGTATYIRLASITTTNGDGADIELMVSGAGSITGYARVNFAMSLSAYGTGASSSSAALRVTALNSNYSDGMVFYTKSVGSFTWEVWALMPAYQSQFTVTVLSAYANTWSVPLDSRSTTNPGSLIAAQNVNAFDLSDNINNNFSSGGRVGATGALIAQGSAMSAITQSGFYRANQPSDAPFTTVNDWYFVVSEVHDSNTATQTINGYGSGSANGRVWTRVKNSGTWTGWNELTRAFTAATYGSQNWVRIGYINTVTGSNYAHLELAVAGLAAWGAPALQLLSFSQYGSGTPQLVVTSLAQGGGLTNATPLFRTRVTGTYVTELWMQSPNSYTNDVEVTTLGNGSASNGINSGAVTMDGLTTTAPSSLVAPTMTYDMNQLSQGYAYVGTATASFTSTTDAGTLLKYNSSSAGTGTIPQNTYPIGAVITFLLQGTGALTIAAGTGVTIWSNSGYRLTTQYAQASITQVATNIWSLTGQTVV